ncbi:hypothetical protein HK100_003244 [Physocladia obscura]|uniref:G-protein coupled receptors family 3 profile domain-containing protein n=1 Tax=Physocladia obscura TaxID=109957 RepID=A0AAD5TBE4_9FUNG|nr:hypothetical protein HK100_003244 [Physocladia obscura]
MKVDPSFIDDSFGIGISTATVNFTSQTAVAYYTPHRPFIFFGGSSTPPNDGWIKIVPQERVIASNGSIATAILVCSYIGHATSIIAMITHVYQKLTKQPGSLPRAFGVFLISGSELVFVSMNYWPGRESVESCTAQSAIFARLFHLSRCLQNKFERARGVSDLSVFLTVFVLSGVNIVIALIYQFSGGSNVAEVTVSRYENYYTCQTDNINTGTYTTYTLYVVGAFLSLGCVYYSHKLKKEPNMKVLDILCKIAVLSGGTMIAIPFLSPETMLPRILRAFVSWILSMGTIIVAFAPNISVLVKGKKAGDDDDFDFGSVIKSGINRDDWSVLESGPLEVLNMGQVHYQTRGILGWSEPKLADLIVHRRKSQLTITFSEINSFIVNAYNVSNLINDDFFDMTRNTSQSGANNAVTRNANGDMEVPDKDSNTHDMEDRIIVITTKSFSVKVITSSTAQAVEIRAQVFGTKDGGGGENKDNGVGSAALGTVRKTVLGD